jgi:hypothetical protein
MSRRLFARFDFSHTLLTARLDSLLECVSTSFFHTLLCFAQSDFHVQLSYRSPTSAWESFLSRICLDLNSKSIVRALLRSA